LQDKKNFKCSDTLKTYEEHDFFCNIRKFFWGASTWYCWDKTSSTRCLQNGR